VEEEMLLTDFGQTMVLMAVVVAVVVQVEPILGEQASNQFSLG
jgi:hypothetical protein